MITLTKDTLWIAEMFMANWSLEKQFSKNMFLIENEILVKKLEINLFLESIFYFLKSLSYSWHNSYQNDFQFPSQIKQQSSKQDEHAQHRKILKILKWIQT